MEHPDKKMKKLMIKSDPTKRLDFTAIETSFINKLVTGKIFDI